MLDLDVGRKDLILRGVGNREFYARLFLDPELSPISSIVAFDPTLLLFDYFAVVARLKACLESTLCSLLT